MKIKANSEIFVLIIFFIFINFVGYANYAGHNIVHDFPYGYRSSDAIQFSFLGEGLKDVGNYRYVSPYSSQGLTNIVPWYFPSFPHLVAGLSVLSGMEAYDTTFFVVFTMMNLAGLIMYFLIKKYNENLALASLPFMAYIYYSRFAIGSSTGIWGYSTAAIFLAAFFFFLAYFEEKNVFVLMALILVSIAHYRTTDLSIAFAVFLAYFLYALANKKCDKEFLKKTFAMAIIALVFSIFYILEFKGLVDALGGGAPHLIDPKNNPERQYFATRPTDFGVFLFTFLLLGAIVSIFYWKKYFLPISVGLIMIGFNYATYLGGSIGVTFNSRAFMLPVFVSFFIGFFIYFLFSLARKFFSEKVWQGIFYAISFIAIIILFYQYQPLQSNDGLFNRERWQAFQWLQKNTPQNANVLFLYGDGYRQTNMLAYAKRKTFSIPDSEVQRQINNGKIDRMQMIGPFYNTFLYRKGLFKFGFVSATSYDYDSSQQDMEHFNKYVLTAMTEQKLDSCSFDYYVVDKYSSIPVAIKNFNDKLKNSVLGKPGFKIAYDNNFLSVLENNNKGADCLG